MTTAAVLAIGDELIAGRYPDLNSGTISKALDRVGVEVRRFAVLSDDRAPLAETIRQLAATHGVLVITGGLGPTLDDVTREAAADAAGVELVRDQGVIDGLRTYFRERGREMPETNERQALFPEGASVLPNLCGTAPGFRLELGGAEVFALPGPPPEMIDMLEREVLPRLSKAGHGSAVVHGAFYLTGLGEGDFAAAVGPWMDRDASPRMGVTSHTGVLSVSLRAEADSLEAAQALLAGRSQAFRERFELHIYSVVEPDLARAVGQLLIERGITLATAESCTGGLLAQRLTSVPGISAVFGDGWVTYANRAKQRELGVPAALFESVGAVSEEVARAMAEGALRESGAQLAVSLTGVAGPDGGTPEKPVGLVWCGLARAGGATEAYELRLPPLGREAVRTFAVHAALDRIRLAVLR